MFGCLGHRRWQSSSTWMHTKRLEAASLVIVKNITRRAKQKVGRWRRSSSQRDKAQAAWLSIHNATTISPLMLQNTEQSRDKTSKACLNRLRKKAAPYSFKWGDSGDAVGVPMQKTEGLASKEVAQLLPQHNVKSSGKALYWPIKNVKAHIL